jgi:hypothetical protein
MIDVTFGPGHAVGETWPFAWSFGTGAFDPVTGAVSSRSEAFEIGSAVDGAGVGFLFNVTTERQMFVIANLTGQVQSQAVGIWGYASAEPLFDLWLFGMSPATRPVNSHYEVGLGMRAIAPVFGIVDHGTQTRTLTPTLSDTRQFPIQPGTIFAGAGVKTYAGAGGFFCGANASIRTTVRSIRVVAW